MLNFTAVTVDGTVRSAALPPQRESSTPRPARPSRHVDDLQSFVVHLEPYGGLFLLLGEPEEDATE